MRTSARSKGSGFTRNFTLLRRGLWGSTSDLHCVREPRGAAVSGMLMAAWWRWCCWAWEAARSAPGDQSRPRRRSRRCSTAGTGTSISRIRPAVRRRACLPGATDVTYQREDHTPFQVRMTLPGDRKVSVKARLVTVDALAEADPTTASPTTMDITTTRAPWPRAATTCSPSRAWRGRTRSRAWAGDRMSGVAASAPAGRGPGRSGSGRGPPRAGRPARTPAG